MVESIRNEETLDPEDWDQLRSLGHRMMDDMMDYLQNIRSTPFLPPTQEAITELMAPLNEEGYGAEKTYEMFHQNFLPHVWKYIKPQFWGFVIGTGSPFGMLSDMLSSGMNNADTTVSVSEPVYRQAINWIKEMLDYPEEAGGVFVSGGSEANFTGLAVARNTKAEVDMKTEGMQGVNRKMTLYCSEETHDCTDRSVELLGLGSEALRWIPTDNECRIKLDALKKAIKKDREQNYHPFCVIGNAGTVNTGAFDDLNAIADLCSKENLWFHVDGAFGSWVKLSETHRGLADGLGRADSLAVDLHKWMNMPYAIGCTLVKDKVSHFSTFVYGHDAEYLKTGMSEWGDIITNPWNLSLALSRAAYSFKAYMLLRAYGRKKYSRIIQKNLDDIGYLAELIRKEPDLELMAPVASNIACFRYKVNGLSESELEKFNRQILGELWKINLMMISDTTVKGKYMLRVCNVNHRTQRQDFDWLIEEVKKAGEKTKSKL
jgi:glutamate/tyrosine decarboxylase-like PLP-dependent enzyme